LDFWLWLQQNLTVFLLMFARISAMLVTAPVLGSRNVPVAAKAGLSILLSYILLPLYGGQVQPLAEGFLPYALLIGKEAILGLILGYFCLLVFQAVQAAGHLLDMQIGFGIVNVFDPQFGGQVPLLGNFKYILAIIVFLISNGHHVVLTALADSFNLLPIGNWTLPLTITDFFAGAVVNVFIIALKVSLPVMVAIFLTDLALGILARMIPQMNLFVVGIPGKLIIGVLMLALALPVYVLLLEVAFDDLYNDLYHLLNLIRAG